MCVAEHYHVCCWITGSVDFKTCTRLLRCLNISMYCTEFPRTPLCICVWHPRILSREVFLQRFGFEFLGLWQIKVSILHVLAFFFWVVMMIPSFISGHNDEKEGSRLLPHDYLSEVFTTFFCYCLFSSVSLHVTQILW